jgi:hypothetical protein
MNHPNGTSEIMIQRNSRSFLFSLAAMVLLVTGEGCGKSDGPEIVPVAGTITRNGKPIPNLFLNFVPVQGRPSWAITDANGQYKLEYDDKQKGAVVGQHAVWVASPPTGSEGMGPEDQPKSSPDLPEILKKYGNQKDTPLKVEVKAANRVLDLQLD